jgi:regulatory protein
MGVAMLTITAIKPQKKKKDRYNIYVDGEFAIGLAAETLVKSGIKIGQEISNEQIQQLIFKNEVANLLAKAYRFLSYRPRSEREIRDYLQRKSKNSSAIPTVLAELRQQGYIDDVEFTKWWVEQRREQNPRGLRLIRSELLQKGVPQKIIDEVLDEFADPEKEIEQAMIAARKKLGTYQSLQPQEFKRKMANYLARRGFGWDAISEVLESLC